MQKQGQKDLIVYDDMQKFFEGHNIEKQEQIDFYTKNMLPGWDIIEKIGRKRQINTKIIEFGQENGDKLYNDIARESDSWTSLKHKDGTRACIATRTMQANMEFVQYALRKSNESLENLTLAKADDIIERIKYQGQKKWGWSLDESIPLKEDKKGSNRKEEQHKPKKKRKETREADIIIWEGKPKSSSGQ